MSQPWAADWEQIVGCDLVPHLIPAGHPQRARRPIGATTLPDGAHAALSDSVGYVELNGLLIAPAAAWQWHGWPRRSLYSPLSVAGVGQQGVALWVQTLPAPCVRVEMPFSEIAAVEHHADGQWRVIAVTGTTGRLLVRYREDGQTGVDDWTRYLRLRAAPMPAPVPPAPFGGHGARTGHDPASFLLDLGDDVIWSGWRSRAQGAACLLAVTARELIIAQSRPGRSRSDTRPRGRCTCLARPCGTPPPGRDHFGCTAPAPTWTLGCGRPRPQTRRPPGCARYSATATAAERAPGRASVASPDTQAGMSVCG